MKVKQTGTRIEKAFFSFLRSLLFRFVSKVNNRIITAPAGHCLGIFVSGFHFMLVINYIFAIGEKKDFFALFNHFCHEIIQTKKGQSKSWWNKQLSLV